MMKLHVSPNPWLYLFVCTLVGIVVPIIVHFALERLRLLAPLGLAPFRPRRPLATVPA